MNTDDEKLAYIQEKLMEALQLFTNKKFSDDVIIYGYCSAIMAIAAVAKMDANSFQKILDRCMKEYKTWKDI